MKILSLSDRDTQAFAIQFAHRLPQNSVICFYGDLGAGKTTFIKGMATALGCCSEAEVCSPTYTYLNIYSGKLSIYHFDLYRLSGEEEFISMGFDEYFTAGGICCIEWSERIAAIVPEDAVRIVLKHVELEKREIEILSQGSL